jgi:exodeoxyribonuclease VII, small subunit
MSKNKKETNFESSLNKLELLVNKMESGEGTLEQSLNWFEEGMGIIKLCQHELKVAEQKVEELIQNNETVSNKVD